MRRLRRLLAKRSSRWDEQVYVVEGLELVRLAITGERPVESLFVASGAEDGPAREVCALARSHGVPVSTLAPGVFERVADTVSPQPVMATVPMVVTSLDAVPRGLVVVLADVRDPGNAGTIVRSAEAAGAAAVVFAGEAVDPFNPKTVRSSAGTVLWSTIAVERDLARCVDDLAGRGFTLRGTTATGGLAYDVADFSGDVALVLGNEAHGLDDATVARLHDLVTIPMAGRAESLNVSVAASVLCFEALRQRRRGTGESR